MHREAGPCQNPHLPKIVKALVEGSASSLGLVRRLYSEYYEIQESQRGLERGQRM